MSVNKKKKMEISNPYMMKNINCIVYLQYCIRCMKYSLKIVKLHNSLLINRLGATVFEVGQITNY